MIDNVMKIGGEIAGFYNATKSFGSFLSGISAEATCTLLEYIKLPKRNAIAKLNRPVLSSRILALQERGRPMTFDNSGWVPQEGGNSDPKTHDDITTTPDAVKATVADLTSVFQTLDHLTRKAVIDSFIAAHASANSVPTRQKFGRKRKSCLTTTLTIC